MKPVTIIAVAALLGFPIYSQAQQRGFGRGPQLTNEQRTCLEEVIGKPGQGERPSREQMEIALNKCGIEKPPMPPERRSSADHNFSQGNGSR